MKYSLRSLMIVITVFGVCLPVWLNHRRYCLDRASEHRMRAVPNVGFPRLIDEQKVEWRRHERIAGEYRRALWMPWLRFWIDDRGPTP